MKKVWKIIRKCLFTILTIIFCVIIYELGVGSIFYVSNKNFYKKVETLENNLTYEYVEGIKTFITDEEFKILQLSDIHIGAGIVSGDNDRMALKAVEKLIHSAQPDLVVITGDLVYPSKIQSGNTDNLKALKMLANTMEALQVYWAPVFGNHDAQKGAMYSRKQLGEYLKSLSYCLFECGPEDIDGVGNYIINIQNSQNKIIQSLYFMDSNDYLTISGNKVSALDNDYDHIHPNQIAWYVANIQKMNQFNKDRGYDEIVPSSLFMHIPFVEYNDAYEQGTLMLGNKKEKTCNGPQYGMFEKIVELKSTKAVFCGHDHLNNFSVEYQGVRLTYGMSIDYIAYVTTKFLSSQRGGTTILVKQDGTLDLAQLPYKQIK